jgi:hypothetical protein
VLQLVWEDYCDVQCLNFGKSSFMQIFNLPVKKGITEFTKMFSGQQLGQNCVP